MKTFKFISTTSHGYLVVPVKDFKDYILANMLMDLTTFNYSYLASKNVYLEEDIEMFVFIKWYQLHYDVKVDFKVVNQNNIRKSCRLSVNYNYIMRSK